MHTRSDVRAYILSLPPGTRHHDDWERAADLLMAAVGSIVGWQNWIVLFVVTALLGGVTAIIVLLFAGRIRKTFWNVGWIMSEVLHLRAPYKSSEELDVRSAKGLRMPHGAVIALGSIAFLAGELRDEAGELLATATATARIIRP